MKTTKFLLAEYQLLSDTIVTAHVSKYCLLGFNMALPQPGFSLEIFMDVFKGNLLYAETTMLLQSAMKNRAGLLKKIQFMNIATNIRFVKLLSMEDEVLTP